MRYFFHTAYQGANYHGWQRNKDVITVQEVIESKLAQILKVPVTVNGCGRTDALVNASQYFFHADIDADCDETFLFRLNRILPADISVFSAIAMEGLPHARFDATERRYEYFIHTYKDPFLNNCSAQYLNLKLDSLKLKEATAILLKYEDYRSFCTSPDKNEHTVCHVKSAAWYTNSDQTQLRFQIASNRFLSKMVRIIIGQLLKVAQGEQSVADFENYLIRKETPRILSPAHPQGLYLSKVIYPYLDLTSKSAIPGLHLKPDFWTGI